MDRDGDGVWDPASTQLDPSDPNAEYVSNGLTVIDMSNADSSPNNSFGIVLRSGNSIEGVTVKGGGGAAEAVNNRKMVICTGQPSTATLSAEVCSITNAVVKDTAAGLGAVYYPVNPDIFPTGSVPASYSVKINGNIIQNTGGDAVLIEGSPGSMTSTVELKRNRATGSYAIPNAGGGHGLIVNNYASTGNTLNINSEGNIIDKNSGTLTARGLIGGTQQTCQSTFWAFAGFPDNPVTISPDTEAAFNSANPDFLWRINKNPAAPDFNK